MRNTETVNEVRRLRESWGWTVVEMAERMGVSPRTVEGWEQGRPMGGTARKLLEDLEKKKKNQK